MVKLQLAKNVSPVAVDDVGNAECITKRLQVLSAVQLIKIESNVSGSSWKGRDSLWLTDDPPQSRSAPRPPQTRSIRPNFWDDPPQVLGRSAPIKLHQI